MKPFKSIASLYFLPRFAATIVYMLQNTEYQAGPYMAWFWRTQNFSAVQSRRILDLTKAARLLLFGLYAGSVLQVAVGAYLLYLGLRGSLPGGVMFGIALVISYPIVWAHLVVVPLLLGRWLVIVPRERRLIAESERIFAAHPGAKIAVAGSYGKTTMKELLLTVLSEGLKVAATPANKNVSISHAVFARKLTGDEAAIILEYGEGAPGDVARFARNTHPTHGIITGLAPAHLDQYKTLQAAGEDIFSLADYLHNKQVYVSTDSESTKPFIKPGYHTYDAAGVLGWNVHNITLDLGGIKFMMQKGGQKLNLHSGLLGRHQVGVLALVAALGLELGLTPVRVQAGVAKTKPFEHRMQPYNLGGAWIIDDTYNGNIEGIRAGTELLAALVAKRKIYVTPGLVDQGGESNTVHEQLGKYIATANPDIVVLMQNSATAAIQRGLDAAGYNGEVRVETQPLEFYTNLKHFVAAGDLVLMQNDWTDNYA